MISPPLFQMTHGGGERINTYMAMPTKQYVAYQKLTSPAYGPPSGGNQGMTRMYSWMRMKKTKSTSQTRNLERGIWARLRWWRMM